MAHDELTAAEIRRRMNNWTNDCMAREVSPAMVICLGNGNLSCDGPPVEVRIMVSQELTPSQVTMLLESIVGTIRTDGANVVFNQGPKASEKGAVDQ
jgi:hypothetical protein